MGCRPAKRASFFFGLALLALPVAEGRDGVCGWRRLARGAVEMRPRRGGALASYPPRRCCGVGELEPSRSHRRNKEQAETTGGVPSQSTSMLAKSPPLPLVVTADTTALGFCTAGNILSPPVVKLSHKKCRGRLKVQRNNDLGKPRDATQKWRVLSADQAQASVVDVDEECKQLLTSLNFSSEDAEKMLKKAFGWIHSPYWSEERTKEVPSAEVVTGVLDYIRSLGLSDEDLYKLLKKFPEVLGCDLDSEVKLNVSKLDSDWGINGKTLRSLLLRNPKVLGYNIDCRGDCMAQCTRCWVRF